MYLQLAHIGVFGIATVGSLIALWRARAIPDTGTRVGLLWLLATSGFWAGAQLITFLNIPLWIASLAYQIGLVAGLGSVGAWLYFCSAYAGYDYHHRPLYRYVGIILFVGLSSIKLTNPLHGRYFTIELATTPFRYASVDLLGLHWIVSILAYSLAAIGLYMLFRLFDQSNIPTTGLGILVSLTAVPVVLNLLSTLGAPGLVANNYEPVGVVAFALGALYIADDSFEQVRWTRHRELMDTINEAVIVVDTDDIVREFNTAAQELFPEIDTGVGLRAIVPEPDANPEVPLEGAESGNVRMLSVERSDEERYYLLKEQSLTIGPARAGRALIVSDVTTVERQRRNLQRQSEALEGLSAAVAHELRNTLTIVSGNLELITEAFDKEDPELTRRFLGRMSVTTDRMIEIVDDLVMSARLSQPVSVLATVPFRQTVYEAFSDVDSEEVSLRVEGEGRIRANPERLDELFQNAARLAAATKSSELIVTLHSDGFRFRMDGESFAASNAAALFEYGTATPQTEAGMLGPNIRMLANAHNWSVSGTNLDGDGIKISIHGVTVIQDGPAESGMTT